MTKKEIEEICSKRGFEANYCGTDTEDKPKGFYVHSLKKTMLIEFQDQLDDETIQWLANTPNLTKHFSVLINYIYKNY